MSFVRKSEPDFRLQGNVKEPRRPHLERRKSASRKGGKKKGG
jgi:hypothetical protein